MLTEASPEDFLHTLEIIRAAYCGDFEFTVLVLVGMAISEDHHRGSSERSRNIRDVVPLNASRCGGQPERSTKVNDISFRLLAEREHFLHFENLLKMFEAVGNESTLAGRRRIPLLQSPELAAQITYYFFCSSLKKIFDVLDGATVRLRGDAAGTHARAEAKVGIETQSPAFWFARRAVGKNFSKEAECLFDCSRVGEWPVVRAASFNVSGREDAWVGLVGDDDREVRFIITEENIVGWLKVLDISGLCQECFNF